MVELDEVIDGCVYHKSAFIAADVASALFKSIKEDIVWRQESIRFKSVTMDLPRLVAWHGDPGAKYWYSGIENVPEPWTGNLRELRDACNAVCMGFPFNSVLLNYYRSGNDSIGMHCDNERDLSQGSSIVTISLGGPRRFDLKSKAKLDGKHVKKSITLEAGSMLVMCGSCQRDWLHGIEKDPKLAPEQQERISLTFRSVNLR